jgi:amino acid adenylation domain-containing protein
MSYLLHQLLEKSARQFPDKIAVIHKTNQITYQNLAKASNQLAHILKTAGVQKGDRVGIYLKKSLEAVIAIFGILKAGAVYVPLDPSAPAQRIAFMLDNCRMKALVSARAQINRLGKSLQKASTVQYLVLTDEVTEIEGTALDNAKVIPWSEVLQSPSSSIPAMGKIETDLAYILYTSGSTGTPKGVMISHRASLTFVNWSYECFQVNFNDRVSSHAPFHFDLSIFDIFTTIKAGATLVLVPPELSVFPIQLAEFIEQQQITIWYSVPSILTQLVLRGNLQQHQCSALRTVLFAGEVFPVKYLRQLMKLWLHPQYYNLYGPTETNVCTYYKVESIAPEQVEPISIGKACENTEVFAVDEYNQIVRAGEVGELYVRSPSLMTGYWGHSETSQQNRVLFPIDPDIGPEFIYKTGDLVKKTPDGNYFYLGRRDNQIKSRGYRLELGEIETVIYTHPAVEEVAVIAIPHEEFTNEIKAIVAIRPKYELKHNELSTFCTQKLPKYMIPTIIEYRDFLPKTSTGKVDKTLLRQEHLDWINLKFLEVKTR